ncbi:MAG: phosphohistidine phosphatase SixA [Gemmatimonadota bacterium]|nr:phosphohistidine phosphatase SixA [Gemmatimonadota bacterium]
MRAYLMQHGLAKSKAEDPDRPLTDEGRAEVERVAAVAERAGVRVEAVLHSGKTRARQTAELLGARLGPANVEVIDGVSPMDDPGVVADRLEERAGSAAVVGHLPHLSRLAGLLLTGDADREVVAIRNAGLVCLEREGGSWRLLWAVTPDVIVAENR